MRRTIPALAALAASRLDCLFKMKPMDSAPPEGVLVNIPVRMKVPDR